jgi:putative endonuclease
MVTRSKHLGDAGEDAAAEYLSSCGYEILERNYRTRSGEIDLIVKKENIIAFCEVKSSAFAGPINPEFRVDRRKQIKLTKTAQQYVLDRNPTVDTYRFDIVSVQKKQGRLLIQHFENAYWPPEEWGES